MSWLPGPGYVTASYVVVNVVLEDVDLDGSPLSVIRTSRHKMVPEMSGYSTVAAETMNSRLQKRRTR